MVSVDVKKLSLVLLGYLWCCIFVLYWIHLKSKPNEVGVTAIEDSLNTLHFDQTLTPACLNHCLKCWSCFINLDDVRSWKPGWLTHDKGLRRHDKHALMETELEGLLLLKYITPVFDLACTRSPSLCCTEVRSLARSYNSLLHFFSRLNVFKIVQQMLID